MAHSDQGAGPRGSQPAARTDETFFRRIYEQSPLGIALVDLEGRYVEVNTAFCRLLGYEAHELQGGGFMAVTHPDDVVESRGQIGQALRGEIESFEIEKRYVRKDGSTFWALLTATSIKDDHGRIRYGLKMVQDISGRKAAEAARQESDERWGRLLEHLPDAIGIHRDGRLLYLNEAGVRMTGAASADEILGVYLPEMVQPEERDLVEQRIAATQEGHVARRREIRLRRLDGSVFIGESVAVPLTYEGKPSTLFVLRDITERREAEAAQRLFQAVLEHSDSGVLITDAREPDQPIVYVNPAFERISGYGRAEVEGRNCRLLQGDDRDQEAIEVLRQSVARQQSCRVVLRNYRKDGTRFYNNLVISPVRDEAGRVTHFVGILHDVTAEREAQEALRTSEQHLRAVVQHIPIILYALSPQGHVVLSEGQGLASLGLEPGEMVGRNVLDDYRNDPGVTGQLRRALAGESVHSVVKYGERHLETWFNPMWDEEGGFIGTIGLTVDVTEREQGRARLEASEARYRSLMDGANDAIFIIDAETGRFLNANQRALELTNYRLEDLRGLHHTAIHPATEQERYREIFARVVAAGRGQFSDLVLVGSGGERTPVDVSASVVRVGGDHVIQAICHDLTPHRQAEQIQRRMAERLRTLHEIDQAIQNAISERDIAEAVVTRVSGLVPCDRASVSVVGAGRQEWSILAAWANGPTRLGGGVRFSVLRQAEHEDLLRGGVTHVKKGGVAGLDHYLAAVLEAERIVSRLRVPLIVHDRVIGSLNVGAHEPGGFSDEDVDIVTEVAASLAVALHSARLFEEVRHSRERQEALSRKLVAVQEAERRHIALELHDQVGQMLTALGLLLETTAAALPAELSGRLEQARHVARQITDRVRSLSLDLRPSLLDDLGLLPALLWLIQGYGRQTEIEVDFRHAGLTGRRFEPEVETAAFRIVQEALTNVARHGDVREVSVRTWTDGPHLRLHVAQPGGGFDPEVVQAPGRSAGLSGMRERAALVGGTCTIQSAPGQGVDVFAALPIDDAAGKSL